MNKIFTSLSFILISISTFSQVPTSGLVAYYPFNGNAQDAVGTNHGAVNGATLTTDRKGNISNAYSFNGSSNYIQIPHSNTFNITGVITLSVWINTNNVNLSQRIIDKTTVSGSDAYMIDFRPSQQIRFIVANAGSNGQTQAQSDAVFTNNNQWYHFVVTYDNNNVRFYKDGLIINTKIQTGSSINNSNPLRFGANSLLNGDWFNGKLDDIRIYNRALTDTEVQQLYQAEAPPTDITTGLVAHYKMDGDAQDASGFNNHGTQQGGVNFTTATDRFGIAGKAVGFDGIDDYIEIPNSTSLNLNYTTLSVWVNAKSSSEVVSYLITKGWDSQQNYGIYLINGNLGTGIQARVSGSWLKSESTNQYNVNQWFNIVGTYDGNKFKVFVNGNKVSENIVNGVLIPNNQNLFLGRNSTLYGTFPYRLNGLLDDVRIYNRALSDADVLALYNLENNANLTNVKIEPLLEPINQPSYEVPREATVHRYYKAVKNSDGITPVKDVTIVYDYGAFQHNSLPSDSLGLIDLNILVGGLNPNDSSDDWSYGLGTKQVAFKSLLVGNVTGTNAFTPFNITVIDKAQPIDKEMGMAFGVKVNVFGTDSEVPKPLGNKSFKTFSRSASIGITFGPQFTFKAVNANEWDITAGASVGAFAELEAEAKFSLGKPTLAITGQGSIGLDTKADLKVRLNLDDAKQCFKFAKSLFAVHAKSSAEFLKLSSFFNNAIDLGTTPTNPFTFKGNTIGSAISADGGISVTISAPETSIYNFKGNGNILKVTPSLSFNAEASFTSEMSNTFDVDEGLTFNNSISAGAEMNVNLEALSRLSSRGSSSRFSIQNLPFKLYSNSIYNTFALSNKFDLGNNPTGTLISLSSQKKESIVGQTTEFLKTNYVNNWEYGQRANEKVYAVSFNGGVLENNRIASFISKNQTLLGSLWKEPANSDSYYNSILTLNEYILQNALSNWTNSDITQDEIKIYSQREISYQKEGGIAVEIPLLKTDLGAFNYTSWNTYTHDFEKSRFSKSLNRVLPTVSLPDITSNLILPEQDLLSLLWTKIKTHVENLGTALVNQAFGFVTEQFYAFINNVTILTNGVFGSSNTFIRKSLSGEIIYDKSSKDKSLTASVPSVFTFTINPSPQVFTTTTSLKFTYFYPENQLNAVTAIDTFRIISDVFYLNATDGTTSVNIAPNGNFNINTNFSPNDLALASLPSNMIPRIMFKPNNSDTWEDIGAINQNISFNKLGTFGIGVKISNDFTPPVINATIPPIFTSPNSVIFDLSDNKSGIDWQKTKIWANGTLINYTRVSNTNQINIPISSLPTNAQNTFLVQIVTYDLAGNQQLYNRLLPCNYSLTINSLLDRIGNPLTEQATTKIEINAKVPNNKDLHLKAGQNITLEPGFEMNNGKVFKAEIGGCSN